MELELQRLDRKYAGLRVLAADRLGPLVASLAEVGQQNAVLVVLTSPTTAVLIDGYRRVAALDKLGRDTVQAVAVELSEPDALLMRHELAAVQERSALEDGWLLRELLDSHQLSQGQLGARLGRSVSWVSRRLGLARDLPECVQDLVRQGWVPAQGAMKYLLPLSRDNTQACLALARSLAGARWSVRQIADIYAGWRKADGETRQRIEQEPGLYCRARAEVTAPPVDMPARDAKLAQDLQKLRGLCVRLRGLLGPRLRLQERLGATEVLVAAWRQSEEAFAALQVVVAEGLRHAQ